MPGTRARALASCLACSLLGCRDDAPPVAPEVAPAEPPVEPTPDLGRTADAPEPEPSTPPPLDAAQPDPVVERGGAHAVVAYAGDLDEVAVLPEGMAFANIGRIWAYTAETESVRQLAEVEDPHDLVTDGRWLYWLGYQRNGRLELATGEQRSLPPLSAAGDEAELARGDRLYASTRSGTLWHLDGTHLRRLPFEPDPARRLLGGLEAGRGVVYVAALEGAAEDRPRVLLRVGLDGKVDRAPFVVAGRQRRDASEQGGLLFVPQGTETVMRWPTRGDARVLFDAPGVAAVCWCGRDVCTIADDGTVRRHRGAKAAGETIAEGAGTVSRLDCSDRALAWTNPRGENDEGARVQWLALPPD